MLNILTGMLLAIYIGKEYTTGFIKNIITAHANKYDYLVSKGLTALICNAVFVAVYLITLFVMGAVMGLPAEIPSIIGMALYIIEKLLLSIPMSMLMIAINLVFRRSYGWSIVFICIAATGIVVMSIQMGLQMLGLGALASVFNFTITGASAFATTTLDILIPLLMRCLKVTDELAASGTTRGLELEEKRYALRDVRFSLPEYLVCIAGLLFLGTLLFLDHTSIGEIALWRV